jgi:predicted permease
MLDGTGQDLRYALRLLRRNPLFALTAVLSLAVGIGANTTIFTIVNALLLRPPAGIADPARLVDIGRSQNGSDFDNNSYPNYLDVRARSASFSGVYAARLEPQPMSLGGSDGAERVYGGVVSANYFTVLGTQPHIGRMFTLADGEQPGATPLAVISHRLWTRRFNADPRIVGQTMVLNGHAFTVVGVARERFQGTSILAPDLWVPIPMAGEVMPRIGSSILMNRGAVWLVFGARLKPGVSLRQAQAEMALLGQALEREHPALNRGRGLVVARSSAFPGHTGPIVAFMALLMGIVGLVLLIACVNLTGVLLARAASRRREIAVRLAVGAGRARLIRQLLTETLILFMLGAVAGLALARVMTTLLLGLLPALPFPVDVALALDGRVLAFTIALSFVAALTSGLVPALAASNADLVSTMKDDQQAPGRLRLRNAFVVAQVALSLLLVVGGGLFLRALQRAGSIDPGFDARGIELTALDLSIGGYDDARGRIFAHQLIERVRAIPGVDEASLAAVVPLGGGGMGLGGLSAPGVTAPNGRDFFDADWNVVEPRYFATLRMPLVAGRDFTDADREGSPRVAIVNETMAGRFWPGRSALGKELLHDAGRTPAGAPDIRRLAVVGVARDGKYRALDDRPRMFIFVPLQQVYTARLTIAARPVAGRRVQTDVRALLAQMDPNLPIVRAQTFEDYAAVGLIPQRVAASVSGSLGIVGLLLAAIGIYGVTAYAVARRTREIGIRMALGAQQRDVVRMVLRQGMTLALGGVGIGLVLAAGGSRLLAGLLLGIPPLDAVTFIGAALLFAVVGVIACFVPARRATRIDAMEALRYE